MGGSHFIVKPNHVFRLGWGIDKKNEDTTNFFKNVLVTLDRTKLLWLKEGGGIGRSIEIWKFVLGVDIGPKETKKYQVDLWFTSPQRCKIKFVQASKVGWLNEINLLFSPLVVE